MGDALLNADTGSPRVVRIRVNTIPGQAQALCDIRIPPGVTVDCVRAELAAVVGPRPGVSWRILACTEPSWTDSGDDLVRAAHANAVSSFGVAVWRCGGVAVWRCGGVAVWPELDTS